MNDTSSLRRERSLLVLLGFVCLGLVGGALYLQFAKHEDPCPLCIIQRYLFLLIALFAFVGAARKGWRGIALFETLPARWLPSVFKVGGLCETVYPPIFGILLPGWALIAFVLIFIPVATSLWRRRDRRRLRAV